MTSFLGRSKVREHGGISVFFLGDVLCNIEISNFKTTNSNNFVKI